MVKPAAQCDVIVAGCGIAGLSAAVAAQQGGVRVVVLERAPIVERGGNTRYTGAWLRMKSVDEVSDDFIEHFALNAGGYLDPSLVHLSSNDSENWPPTLRAMSFADLEVVATFAEEAPHTLRWLQGFGVRFEKLEVPFLTSVQPRMAPHGGGFALVEALATEFENKGGVIHYDTAAQALIQNGDGAVIGLRAVGPRNRPLEYRGGAVILGCGGLSRSSCGWRRSLSRAAPPRSIPRGCTSVSG